MRLLIQRVLSASVSVNGDEVSRIGPGLLILLGLNRTDNIKTVRKWAEKAVKVRLWPDLGRGRVPQAGSEQAQASGAVAAVENDSTSAPQGDGEGTGSDSNTPVGTYTGQHPRGDGGWKTCVADNDFEVLVVSQFTLYSIFKGNKPDFHDSMPADDARKLYDAFIDHMRAKYHPERVKGGKFQEYMHVSLVNDGPVTIFVDEDSEEPQQGKDGAKKGKQAQADQQQQQQQQQQQKQQGEHVQAKKPKEPRKPKPQPQQQQQQQEQQQQQTVAKEEEEVKQEDLERKN